MRSLAVVVALLCGGASAAQAQGYIPGLLYYFADPGQPGCYEVNGIGAFVMVPCLSQTPLEAAAKACARHLEDDRSGAGTLMGQYKAGWEDCTKIDAEMRRQAAERREKAQADAETKDRDALAKGLATIKEGEKP